MVNDIKFPSEELMVEKISSSELNSDYSLEGDQVLFIKSKPDNLFPYC